MWYELHAPSRICYLPLVWWPGEVGLSYACQVFYPVTQYLLKTIYNLLILIPKMFIFSCSVFALAATTWLVRLSYLAYFSPLACVPNAHPLAPFSKLWLLWLRYSGQEHHTRYLLHTRLGPVIRLAPQELGVNCIDDGVWTIYNGNFDKSPWFAGFVLYG